MLNNSGEDDDHLSLSWSRRELLDRGRYVRLDLVRLMRPDVPVHVRRLHLVMQSFGLQGNAGCFTSQQILAAACGIKERAIRKALARAVSTAALSVPRGNGKSFLTAVVAARVLRLLQRHQEVALAAASIEQGRIVFRFIRHILREEGYRYLDFSTRCSITNANGGG